MRKAKVVVTPEQKVTLERLKFLLTEKGYLIFPVEDLFRQHELDFIAMPKVWPRKFVRFRPIQSGKIMVQSFASRQQYRGLKKFLETATGLAAPVRWSGSQLPFARVRPDWWKEYIPEKNRQELALLGFD